MKSFIKTFLCFVIAGLIGCVAFLLNSTKFSTLAGDTLLSMIGTIFAINIGVLPVLFYELNKVEKELGAAGSLDSVKREIKQNAVVMTSIVILAIALGIIKDLVVPWAEFTLSSLILALVFLAVIMLYDTVSGILALDSVLNKKGD